MTRPSARGAARVAAKYALCAALTLPSLAAAQQAGEFARLETVIESEMRRTGTPGLSIAVVRGDRVAYVRAFGVGNGETGAPATPDMLFQIGSLTKPFTAALLVTLAERGVLRLDRPVSAYVRGLAEPIGRVTPHELLSQTSGLKDLPADSGAHDEGELSRFVRSWDASYALLPPRTVFSYSNPGFALAGLVAEEAAGAPYATLMTDHLFRPLGMRRTTFRPTEALTYPRADGHTAPPNEPARVVRPVADDTRFWPAGYMHSSVQDLARFAIAFMNGGRIDGAQALPAALPGRMARPAAVVPNPFDRTSYGYGLFVDTIAGTASVWHPGSMPGFSAIMRLAPARRFGVVVLANRDQVRLDAIVDAAFAVLTASPPERQVVSRQATAMSADEMRRYAGRYANRWPMEVIVRNDSLLLRRFGTEVALTKIGAHRFVAGDPTRAPRGEELEIHPPAGPTPAYVHMYLWAFSAAPVARR